MTGMRVDRTIVRYIRLEHVDLRVEIDEWDPEPATHWCPESPGDYEVTSCVVDRVDGRRPTESERARYNDWCGSLSQESIIDRLRKERVV